jgi:hypothetical protein
VRDDEALLLSEEMIEERLYNTDSKDVTWEMCTLREYLNGEFLQTFDLEEQSLIVEKTISNKDNLWYETSGGEDTNDKIFLLSLEEVDEYFGNSGDYKSKRRKSWNQEVGAYIEDSDYGVYISNKNDSDRVAKCSNGKFGWWWLRSPGTDGGRAASVYDDGSVYVRGNDVDSDGGVRLTLWLNLKSKIF